MFCLERKYMIKRAVLLYLGLACVIPLQGHGANPIDTQEQLDRARASQEAREARLGEERIQWQHISSNTDGKTPRPASGPMSVGSLSNVGVFTLRAFFGTNHMYGWCHSFCSKVEYVL